MERRSKIINYLSKTSLSAPLSKDMGPKSGPKCLNNSTILLEGVRNPENSADKGILFTYKDGIII